MADFKRHSGELAFDQNLSKSQGFFHWAFCFLVLLSDLITGEHNVSQQLPASPKSYLFLLLEGKCLRHSKARVGAQS